MKRFTRHYEGLTRWVLMYGRQWVSFNELVKEGLTGYYPFDKALEANYLERRYEVGMMHADYKLTEKAIEYVRNHNAD